LRMIVGGGFYRLSGLAGRETLAVTSAQAGRHDELDVVTAGPTRRRWRANSARSP
jgi:hypothetical protein